MTRVHDENGSAGAIRTAVGTATTSVAPSHFRWTLRVHRRPARSPRETSVRGLFDRPSSVSWPIYLAEPRLFRWRTVDTPPATASSQRRRPHPRVDVPSNRDPTRGRRQITGPLAAGSYINSRPVAKTARRREIALVGGRRYRISRPSARPTARRDAGGRRRPRRRWDRPWCRALRAPRTRRRSSRSR